VSIRAAAVRDQGDGPNFKRSITMARYLLSTHTVDGEAREPMTDDDMERLMTRIGALEEEMRSAGAWVFSGRLHGPDTATVVRHQGGEVLTTDGPFAEAKEHLGGFYIVEAEDLDAALAWASKTAECIRRAIEVRPFMHTEGA
jgi:hypothetical protein